MILTFPKGITPKLNVIATGITSGYTTDYFANFTRNSVQRDLKCWGVDHYHKWFRYLEDVSLPGSCRRGICVNISRDSILVINV